MKKLLVLAICLLNLSCASKKVIIDTYGVNQAQYEKDLAQCEQIATQVETGKTVGKSSIFGAVVGGAIGAITGDFKSGALTGGVQGAAVGGVRSDSEEAGVLKKCMKNRGYSVLN